MIGYYSAEKDAFMSCSQLKKWVECQAAAHARFVAHTYKEPTSKAMAQGSLLDALLTDPEREQEILSEYAEHLLLKGGGPSADTRRIYEQADAVKGIKELWAYLQTFDKQTELYFELGGMRWKCRMDYCGIEQGFLLDLKRTKSNWKSSFVPRLGCHGGFIAEHYYAQQLAIYREAVRQKHGKNLHPGIVGVSLSEGKCPDVAVRIWKNEGLWQIDKALEETLELIPDLKKWRESSPEKLWRCEECDYCVMTRKNFIFEYMDPTPYKKER
jgi:hypothetical protein